MGEWLSRLAHQESAVQMKSGLSADRSADVVNVRHVAAAFGEVANARLDQANSHRSPQSHPCQTVHQAEKILGESSDNEQLIPRGISARPPGECALRSAK